MLLERDQLDDERLFLSASTARTAAPAAAVAPPNAISQRFRRARRSARVVVRSGAGQNLDLFRMLRTKVMQQMQGLHDQQGRIGQFRREHGAPPGSMQVQRVPAQ